jgi:xanthine dehydrogenase large subunit
MGTIGSNTALRCFGDAQGVIVKRSKAVGEPPFMPGVSVFETLGMAVASVAGYGVAPATPERVLMACERLRKEAA